MALLRRLKDAPLGLRTGEGDWTLERVHLCEHPPHFPSIYFAFADDSLDSVALKQLDRVASELLRHPKLCICLEGFADPSAPDQIGHAVAQARAIITRTALLRILQRRSRSG